ncbi:hypothetical protein [Leptolyngbya iicbica]|uniref:Cell division protein FtsL n=2 Tax=Cyanophyceae TaxID=3028117 RepID=A0A4Q7E674_9CYAN|nr:hypothetical protein [Leptolyngbya sp. LK]RZM77395.1 hypothetical protein DYY88_17330 [Leptolyngbya sp. LK]
MSAALKSEPLELRPRSAPAATAQPRERRLTVVPTTPASPLAFPPADRAHRPLWLKLLSAGQRVSVVVAGMTIAAALSAYAVTVDTNRRLAVATTSLGQLQDQQQQLVTANAVFKNHLAQTALAAMDNGTLHPKDVIFLEITEPSPAAVASPPATPAKAAIAPDRRFFPKGY